MVLASGNLFEALGVAPCLHAFDDTDVFVVEIVPVTDHVFARIAIFVGVCTVTDEVKRDGFAASLRRNRGDDEYVDLIGKDLETEIREQDEPVAAVAADLLRAQRHRVPGIA